MIDLEAIRARCENITKGPWHAFTRNGVVAVMDMWDGEVVHWSGFDGATAKGAVSLRRQENNARFIAHARTDIPELLDHIAALEQRIEEMEK